MWDSLRNILTAYAAHDPVMGYVQSMNFIAAFLLMAGYGLADIARHVIRRL
jgi:prephenate dehydrogenase